jgi:hypothetical protein
MITITLEAVASLPEIKKIMDNKDNKAMPNKNWQKILKECKQPNGEYDKKKLIGKILGMAEFFTRPPMTRGVGTSDDTVLQAKAREAVHKALEIYASRLEKENVKPMFYFRDLSNKTKEDVKK